MRGGHGMRSSVLSEALPDAPPADWTSVSRCLRRCGSRARRRRRGRPAPPGRPHTRTPRPPVRRIGSRLDRRRRLVIPAHAQSFRFRPAARLLDQSLQLPLPLALPSAGRVPRRRRRAVPPPDSDSDHTNSPSPRQRDPRGGLRQRRLIPDRQPSPLVAHRPRRASVLGGQPPAPRPRGTSSDGRLIRRLEVSDRTPSGRRPPPHPTAYTNSAAPRNCSAQPMSGSLFEQTIKD